MIIKTINNLIFTFFLKRSLKNVTLFTPGTLNLVTSVLQHAVLQITGADSQLRFEALKSTDKQCRTCRPFRTWFLNKQN